MSTSLISVVIPSYNSARYLPETIESILAQDYRPLEIIIVDDGSTDDTYQVFDTYRQQIRIANLPHSGISKARNHGLCMAQGKYLVFLDSDDRMLPGKLRSQAELLDQNPELAYVHSGWELVDPAGVHLDAVEPWKKSTSLELNDWFTNELYFLGAILFRRDCLEKTGEFNPDYLQSEDVDYLLRLVLSGAKGTLLPALTVSYRQHPTSTTKNISQRAYYAYLVPRQFFERPDLPDDVRGLRNHVLFYVLIWCVFILQRARLWDEIPHYLGESRQYVDYPAVRLSISWLNVLMGMANPGSPHSLDGIDQVIPIINQVLQLDDSTWQPLERMLQNMLRAERLRRGQAARIP
jgi:glycosyltransferase involved in cell wall biosynthesis